LALSDSLLKTKKQTTPQLFPFVDKLSECDVNQPQFRTASHLHQTNPFQLDELPEAFHRPNQNPTEKK
jgi:hypothetical protein